jgi:hypothetical protein
MSQPKREIKPLSFGIDVVSAPEGKILVVAHPLEGDVYLYELDDVTTQRILSKLTGGIEIATEVPHG